MSFRGVAVLIAAAMLPLQGCARLGFGEKNPPAETLTDEIGRAHV